MNACIANALSRSHSNTLRALSFRFDLICIETFKVFGIVIYLDGAGMVLPHLFIQATMVFWQVVCVVGERKLFNALNLNAVAEMETAELYDVGRTVRV